MTTQQVQVETPVGWFFVEVTDGAVTRSDFRDWGEMAYATDPVAVSVRQAIVAYFDGDVDALDAIPVRTAGSAFQERVWKLLREIPAGKTRSYGDLAGDLGLPGAARAVGMANASNPVGVIVPCHRVVRSTGAIGGYAGGVDRKRWLLDHERGTLL